MTDEHTPRLERILEATARKVSGGALHPLEILQRVQEAVEGSARDGVVANDVVITLNPSDYRRFESSLTNLHKEIDGLLDEVERRHHYTRIGSRTVAFELSDSTPEGMPALSVRFRDTRHRDVAPPAGATRRLTRQRNLTLVLGDGSRVRVTHTPFNIGRGTGNDLVLPSLAVSRRHAELVRSADGVVIRDCGSRNGLVVNGQRLSETLWLPGETVTLGDVTLRLESGE